MVKTNGDVLLDVGYLGKTVPDMIDAGFFEQYGVTVDGQCRGFIERMFTHPQGSVLRLTVHTTAPVPWIAGSFVSVEGRPVQG